jgi:hypothetical protein
MSCILTIHRVWIFVFVFILGSMHTDSWEYFYFLLLYRRC